MINGKVMIVTGAGSGIGKGIAICSVKMGAKVIIAEIDKSTGQETEEEILKKGGDALFIQTNVSNESSVKRMVKETINKYNKIDILVNNAGIIIDKSVEEISSKEFKKIIDVNLFGVFLCTKYVFPYMKKEKNGSIINIASTHAINTTANVSAYASTKGGVVAMTRSMGLEFGKYGIRVNAICPGFIWTSIMEKAVSREVDPKAAKKYYENLHPLGHMGKPEDIANFVAFLGSDLSSYMTAATIVVDGGVSAELFKTYQANL